MTPRDRTQPVEVPESCLHLTARPPLHQFTQAGFTAAWSNAGVFLFDHRGQPHWFATDGYSAMLTPALHSALDGNLMFAPSVGKIRAYRADHIKALFKYARAGRVLVEPSTGMLYSTDGIMRVPPYTMYADDGQEPETPPMADVQTAFQGTPTETDGLSLGLKFVHAVRGAFDHLVKDAGVQLTFFEGGRVLLEIESPYAAQVLIASEGDTLHTAEPEPTQPEPTPDQPRLLDGEQDGAA